MSYWTNDCKGKQPLVSMMNIEAGKREKPKIMEGSILLFDNLLHA